MALTARQQSFIKEYLVDLNGAQAAIRAGYSPKAAKEHAARLLTNANLAHAVQAEMDKRSERTEVTADYVLKTITSTIARCQTDEDFNPQAILKGAELLGKHLKLFTEKHEHSGPNGQPIQIIELVPVKPEALLSAPDYIEIVSVQS